MKVPVRPTPALNVQKTIIYHTVQVLYSRDHGGFGFLAQKHHPKTSLTFLLQQFGCIGNDCLGITKLKNIFRLILHPSLL